MAWNLQPFVGDRGAPFQLFRHSEGNFYTAIVYSLERLAQGKENPAPVDPSMRKREIDVRGLLETTRPSGADSLGAAPR
jgi:hypothetical protein